MRPHEALGQAAGEEVGGRVFFSNTSRSRIEEDEIELTSVGIDIGSSTAHLLFSKIVLERFDSRYLVVERSIIHQSPIRLTPYREDDDIDADALASFIAEEYAAVGLSPDDIDAGALILTGVAVSRRNARKIAELFSAEAGKFVAVTAGDALEALMAAHGSGALTRSAESGRPVTNIDIGGGTTKIAVCASGAVASMTAVEAGARLLVFDADGIVERIEPFGRRYLRELGVVMETGDRASPDLRRAVAACMAARIVGAARGGDLGDWLRLPPLVAPADAGELMFSGGVSEFIYGREPNRFSDLGPELAAAVRERVAAWGATIAPAHQGIRATVVGASQHTVQVSGSTIYLDPQTVLPVRNVPVVAPAVDLSAEAIDGATVAAAVADALTRLDLGGGDKPVAVALAWRGSATFHRLSGLCRGLLSGLAPVLARGHPLIVVVDGDIGGVFGIHCREEERLANPIVSIDGIELKEFDFIDIGEILRDTGAVPVVIKSLLFPSDG
jgi:ethanolamine utilization protein EutA (predicted chaperonin)